MAIDEEQEEELSPETKPKRMKRKRHLQAKMELITEHPEKISPLVGYFPSGFDPISEPVKIKMFRSVNRSNRTEIVVGPSNPSSSIVNFVGTSYSGEAATRQACTYGLGVLDKETGILKIMPIVANKIFRIEARIPQPVEDEIPVKEEVTAEKKAGRMRELTHLYGTKKSINQVKKLDSAKQQQDPDTLENLDRTINQDITVHKGALVSDAGPTAHNTPPCDTSASTPEQAYPLDKIILSGEMDFLTDIHHLLEKEIEVAPIDYPCFVRNRFVKLGQIKDEKEQQRCSSILSYITHLIKFKDQNSFDADASAKKHRFPSILRQRFSSMFMEEGSKRMSDQKCALLISYVLVLTLFVDQFESDPTDIAKDLRMRPLKLREHFEQLGCKFRTVNKVSVATLPIPLEFPSMRRKRRR